VSSAPTLLYRTILGATRPVIEHVYRLDVQGLEHVPPDGGLVVAANHTSFVDAWPLAIALRPRSLHFMVKAEAWKPPLSWILSRVGSFRVRRGESDEEAIANAIRVCREGRVMAMFPEGTRRGREPRPHAGAARIALAAGVPLVPAALRGLDRLSRAARLRLRFGTPVPLDDLRSLESHVAAAEATRRLWAEVERLGRELDA
jgi:1-acyl-sn-glycerol-3-phosphate acyltransferase